MPHELSKQPHAKNTKFSVLNVKNLEESLGLDMIIETINQTAKLSQHTCRWTIENIGGKYPMDKLMTINRLFSIGHFIFSDLKAKESISCLMRPASSHSELRECLFSETVFEAIGKPKNFHTYFRLMTINPLQSFFCIEAH